MSRPPVICQTCDHWHPVVYEEDQPLSGWCSIHDRRSEAEAQCVLYHRFNIGPRLSTRRVTICGLAFALWAVVQYLSPPVGLILALAFLAVCGSVLFWRLVQ